MHAESTVTRLPSFKDTTSTSQPLEFLDETSQLQTVALTFSIPFHLALTCCIISPSSISATSVNDKSHVTTAIKERSRA